VIVLETSALIAIVLQEPDANKCAAAIAADSDRKISAGTLAEAMIVADRQKVGDAMKALVERLKAEIVPVHAEKVAEAYRQWGKGNHPAGLNFGDCFAYALAKELACPLLFIGNDFARTDIVRA
jgi:ribonuclease VapC